MFERVRKCVCMREREREREREQLIRDLVQMKVLFQRKREAAAEEESFLVSCYKLFLQTSNWMQSRNE